MLDCQNLEIIPFKLEDVSGSGIVFVKIIKTRNSSNLHSPVNIYKNSSKSYVFFVKYSSVSPLHSKTLTLSERFVLNVGFYRRIL